MKFLVKEIVAHYHAVEINEELDIEKIVSLADGMKSSFDTGYEAVESVLEEYKERYGFDFHVDPNYCGTETLELTALEEM